MARETKGGKGNGKLPARRLALLSHLGNGNTEDTRGLAILARIKIVRGCQPEIAYASVPPRGRVPLGDHGQRSIVWQIVPMGSAS